MDVDKKMREVVRDPESAMTGHGEDAIHPPGSYPEEEFSTPRAISPNPKHDNLSKPMDPQGWVDTDANTRGHKHTDSGIGLADTTQGEYTTAPSLPQPLGFQSDNTTITTSNKGATSFLPQNTTSSQRMNEERGSSPLGRAPEQSSDDSARHTFGTGGIGAPAATPADLKGKREEERDVGVPPIADTSDHPYWGDLPQGMGVYNTVTGHGSQEDDESRRRAIYVEEAQRERNFPLTTAAATTTPGIHTTTAPESSSATKIHDASSKSWNTAGREEDSSRWKEGVAGGVAAGAVGAYALDKKSDERGAHGELTDNRRTENVEDSQDRRHFSLFRRGSKNAEKSGADSVKDNGHREEKQREHKLAGFFHQRSSSKDTDKLKDEKETVPEYHQSEADQAFATAGARAALGRSPEKHEDTHNIQSQPNSYVSGTRERSSEQNVLPGTTSGVRHTGRSETPNDRTSPITSRDDEKIGHEKTKLAAAAATAGGIGGAGYLASRDREDKPSERLKDSAITETWNDSENTSRLPATEGSPASFGASPRTTHTSNTTRLHPNESEADKPPPALADTANKGQYNVLASGTPSGVRIGEESLHMHATTNTRDESAKISHGGAALAAAGLGATGVGAAAYKSQSPKDKELKEVEEEEKERYLKSNESARNNPKSEILGTVTKSSPEKVIHRCHKCGEENDISSYFTSDNRQGH